MQKRTLSMILAALLISQLTACGSSEQVDNDTIDIPSGDAETTAPAGETSGVPEGTDFEGETVNIWYTTKASSVAETFVDLDPEQSGDILDDAIFDANVAVEEKLNLNLEFFNSGVPTSNTGTEIRKLILADDTSYDVYHGVQWNCRDLVLEGLFYDVGDAPYLSLDKPWWDSDYMDAMSIGDDRVFALIGDYAVDRTRCLACIYYNKNMFEDFYGDGDALYQEVIDKKWTHDRLAEISAEVYSDVNNDGKADRDDILGYCINDYNNLDGLFFGSGVRVSERNKDGYPTLVLNNENTVDAITSLYSLVFETEGVYFSGPKYEEDVKNRNKFAEGTSMFLHGFFYTAEAMRDMKDNYGIVPAPLLDEDQENYQSILHNIMRIMFLPNNCQKVDAVCAALEELSFEGYQNVLPQYYDVLMKNKYARDDVSAEMIDIIRDTLLTDIGVIYSFNNLGNIHRLLIQEKSSNFASKYASSEEAALAKIQEYIALFEKID